MKIRDRRIGEYIDVADYVENKENYEEYFVVLNGYTQQITLVENTQNENKARMVIVRDNDFGLLDIQRVSNRYYLTALGDYGSVYRRELTQEVIDDYGLTFVWMS